MAEDVGETTRGQVKGGLLQGIRQLDRILLSLHRRYVEMLPQGRPAWACRWSLANVTTEWRWGRRAVGHT